MSKPKKRLVKDEEHKPCGCHVVVFSDDTKELSPCPPCGMFAVARALGQAADAMAAVATTLNVNMQRASMGAAVQAALQKKKGKESGR